MIGCFLVLWFLSVGFCGTQRRMFRSSAGRDSEVACPRDLVFPPPPMADAHPHTIEPPRSSNPGRGGAASLPTHDMVAEVKNHVLPINIHPQEICVTPEITQKLCSMKPLSRISTKMYFRFGWFQAPIIVMIWKKPPSTNLNTRDAEKFYWHLRLRGAQEILSIFLAKDWEEISNINFWYVQRSKGKVFLALSARLEKNALDISSRFFKMVVQVRRWLIPNVRLTTLPIHPLSRPPIQTFYQAHFINFWLPPPSPLLHPRKSKHWNKFPFVNLQRLFSWKGKLLPWISSCKA